MRRSKIAISIAILLIVGLHAVPVLSAGLRKRVWPFLDWAMYKDALPPGPIQASIRRMVGVSAKGKRIPVTTDTVGLSSFALERLYLRPMRSGDSSAAYQLIDRLNRRRDDPLVELRLESATYTATDTGIVEEDNPVITYRVDLSPSR